MSTTRMRGLWLEQQHLSYREDLPIPVPQAGEALVQVTLAGICGTDLALRQGYYPFTGIPGHEFSGVIVSAPDAPQREGERVSGEINLSCGECALCRDGRPRHCRQRQVLGILNHHGAFADYLTLPLANLHPLPAGVSERAAVFTEPLAAALRIQEQIRLPPGQSLLVIGAGRLGQLIAAALAAAGYAVQAVARYPAQRACLARHNIPWLAETEVPGHAFDTVVEATGSPAGFALARHAVRPGGTLVLKSTYRGEVSVNFAALVVDEITLVGSRCGPFAPALALLATGFDPTDLVAATYPLHEGVRAFEQAARAGVLKVLLQPECQTFV